MSIPPTGLISEIDFLNPACFTNGGTAVTDLSGSGNNWNFPNTTYSFNSFKGTITFPDTNMQLQRAGLYSGNVQFTIAYWCYYDSSDPISHSYDNGNYYSNPSGFVTFMMQIGGHMSFYLGGTAYLGPNYCETPDGVLLDKQYNHICVTFDGTTAKTYVNNVNYNTLTVSINQNAANDIYFNAYVGPYNLKGFGLAYFYDAGLNSTQVSQIYNDGYLRLGGINAPDVSIDFLNPACFTNGGTAITDLSGNGKNFTLSSTTYTFDNSNGSITMPNGTTASSTPSNFLYGTTAFSMLCWVNIGTGSYQTNICRIGGDAFGSRFMPYSTATNDYLIMDGAGTAGAWNANITPGWHLLALTRPANCLCLDQKFYVDGVLIPFDAGSYNPSTPMNMNQALFGELNDGYAGVGKPLNIGTFDLYTTEISEADILTIYNNEVSRFYPVPTPIAEYDFQNGSYPGSGTTVFDLSGTGNTLAITNGGTWVSGTPNYFDLNNNTAIYKSPAVGGIASTNIFSMNLWYYKLTEEDDGIVFYLGKDYPNEGATFGLGFGSQFAVSGGFGYGIIPVTTTSPGWNFISYVSTGSSTTAYLNGASVGSTSNVPSIPSDGGICLGTGLSNGSPPTPRIELAGIGRIGYASIFTEVLTQPEIADIYNATVSSYPSPLPPVTGLSNGRRFGQGFPQ